MNGLRAITRVGRIAPSIRSFSGGPVKAVTGAALSLMKKAPKTCLVLGTLAFANHKYEQFKLQVEDKLHPAKGLLEKMGLKKSEEKQPTFLEQSHALFMSALNSDPTPFVIEQVEQLTRYIAPPQKEDNSVVIPESKTVFSSLTNCVQAVNKRINHELQCKKTALEKEISEKSGK